MHFNGANASANLCLFETHCYAIAACARNLQHGTNFNISAVYGHGNKRTDNPTKCLKYQARIYKQNVMLLLSSSLLNQVSYYSMSTGSSGMSKVPNLPFLYRVHTYMLAVFEFSYFARKTILVCLYKVTMHFKTFFLKSIHENPLQRKQEYDFS